MKRVRELTASDGSERGVERERRTSGIKETIVWKEGDGQRSTKNLLHATRIDALLLGLDEVDNLLQRRRIILSKLLTRACEGT